jgi:signal transduction histidine kinase
VPQVLISVLDDGMGMPPELIAAPFEPARRPSPGNGNGNGNGAGSPNANHGAGSATNGRSSRKGAGAGFGLSIAKGIVQAHGGRIELMALPKGTCFSVYLPVEAGNGGPAAAQRAMEFTGANDD